MFRVIVCLIFFSIIGFNACEIPWKGQKVFHVKQGGPPNGDGLTWETAYTNIQEALEKVSPNDAIWIAQGEYTCNISILPIDQAEMPIHIYGGFKGTETTLSQRDYINNVTELIAEDPSDDVIDIRWEMVVVDGLTVSGSDASGIKIYSARESVFPIIRNCTFTNNSIGLKNVYSKTNVSNCDFIDNDYGIESDYPDMADQLTIVSDCRFKGNADYAIYCGMGAILNITRSVFENNGAGIHFAEKLVDRETLLEIGQNTLESSLFTGTINTSVTTAINAFLMVSGCTFSDNEGPIIEANGPVGSVRFYNSIVWENTHPFSYSHVIDVLYSNIEGGYPGDDSNIGELPEHNPLFVNAEDGDYHLQSGSPCIDTGSNLLSDILGTDLDGELRIIDGNENSLPLIDMGAYEYSP